MNFNGLIRDEIARKLSSYGDFREHRTPFTSDNIGAVSASDFYFVDCFTDSTSINRVGNHFRASKQVVIELFAKSRQDPIESRDKMEELLFCITSDLCEKSSIHLSQFEDIEPVSVNVEQLGDNALWTKGEITVTFLVGFEQN